MWSATSLEELCDFIGIYKITLKETKRIFTSEVLQEQLKKVIKKGDKEITNLTNTCGFRDLVYRLFREKRIKKKQ